MRAPAAKAFRDWRDDRVARLQRLLSLPRGTWLPILRSLPSKISSAALSFDDGPNDTSTPLLLDALDRHGARASFFLSGFRAVHHPDLVGEIVRRGHEIYGHGWHHVRHDALTPDEIVASLARTETLLAAWRPTPDRYLVRLPYGAGHKTLHVHQAIQKWRAGCEIAHWSVSPVDWRIADRCFSLADVERECGRAVHELLAGHGSLIGSILLLHDQPVGGGDRYAAETTVRFAEMLLDELGRLGVKAMPIAPAVRGGSPARTPSRQSISPVGPPA